MGKTAFVSGASRGIGKAIAESLAKEGYDLHLTCLHSINLLRELKKQLEEEYGIRCRAESCDMSSYEAVAHFFEPIKQLDILINNAGISSVRLITETTPEEWHRVLDTNLSAVFYTCRLAIPLMLQAGRGRIINISSVWGNTGASMETAYSASKGGVNSLTKALAKELAPSHISVNAIACGFIDTQMNQNLTQEERMLIKEEIPADRFGREEEVARLVKAVLDTPHYMTGQIITMDGGWT